MRGALNCEKQTLRLFSAVEVPERIRQLIVERFQEVRRSAPEARASWERLENIHLTLKFFGSVEFSKQAALVSACESASAGSKAFDLSITKSGAFQKRKSLPILWLGVESSGNGLSNLATRLETECEDAGFEREKRPFSPHITIARVKSFNDADRLVESHLNLRVEPQTFRVDQFVLIKSELGPAGSKYSVLSHFKLSS